MDAYFNTSLKNLTDEDLKRIINVCNSEIQKREVEHYDRLYENIIDSLSDMVKYFPTATSLVCPDCREEYDWDDVLTMIKNYHE